LDKYKDIEKKGFFFWILVIFNMHNHYVHK
jgi:hypothetical protein